ncbi:MAG: protein kinase [Solirubrobacterales bacterium]|nr:protein kinase [Solirubrobacterales bacterium]
MPRRSARFELGAVVADRRIDAIAGEGGMGIVYRAWNLRLKRVEAVKVISEEFVRDKSFRDRFARETELAASIEHPNVVTLYDSGEGPGGELFIAMRYVEGTTLERMIKERGHLDPRMAAELTAQVASALDAAHGQGLVHRDVKPANILIASHAGRLHAYLTDFGLAKRVSSQSALTGIGLMVGTIDYMAPEQAGTRPVDLRADVYALGATLFVALTGQVPYPRDGDLARLVAKIGESPPMVSEVTPGVPTAFDLVISRAMAEDPADRYESAGELGHAALGASGRRSTGSGRGARAPDPITVGSVIDDRYQIEAEAGSGGMAVVYRATHLKLAKTVALKVMSPNLAADPEFQRRFEGEARAASEIDHENVIPVYDFGEDEHGLYIVMRYVEQNLRDLLRARGAMEPRRAVQVIEQVASALDAAHDRGLLHRDIKPANILVEESTSRIFLADFGLVRAGGEDVMTGSRVLGTDWYMAPERRRHEETKLGDVYSLGCVLWEMLAGPGQHLPGRSAVQGATTVPPGLRAVVEQAASERPLERYPSAGELARAARSALEPVAGQEQRRQESPVFHDPLSAGLSARVLDLCTQTLPTATHPEAREALEGIRERLAEPLVMAIAGRAGTAKSTLVNALLGREIADTSAGERAQVVTWLRYGDPGRVELETVDGGRRRIDLTAGGGMPERLAVPVDQVAAIEIYLTVHALKSLTIVDTPGVDTPGVDAAGTELKGTIERADALLFAMAGDAVSADREALAAFRGRLEGTGHASALNAIGVLTKADLLGSPADATERALELREALGSLVSDVVPVATHIAQTVNCGALNEEDVARLARWAQLDPAERELLLPVEGRGAESAAPGPARVLRLLGRAGIERALELADSGDPFNLVSLNRRLRELCGIDELRKQIDGVQLRTDALKADRALTELESVSWRHHLADLRNQIDRMRIDNPLLELMRLFDRCASGQVELDDGRLEELERLLIGRTLPDRLGLGPSASPDDVRRAATRRARGWRTWAGGGLASFQGQQVANKVDDVYMQIAFPDEE